MSEFPIEIEDVDAWDALLHRVSSQQLYAAANSIISQMGNEDRLNQAISAVQVICPRYADVITVVIQLLSITLKEARPADRPKIMKAVAVLSLQIASVREVNTSLKRIQS